MFVDCLSTSVGLPHLSVVFSSLISRYRQSWMSCVAVSILTSCVVRGLVEMPVHFFISLIKLAVRCILLDCSVSSLTLPFPFAWG